MEIINMTTIIRVAVFSIFLKSSVLHATEPVQIKRGFLTGNTFQELSEAQKKGYAMGFIGGVFVSPMFDAPKSRLQWIENCVVGMSDKQIVAIIEKFLRDNPARWHETMNILAWVAMKEGCK